MGDHGKILAFLNDAGPAALVYRELLAPVDDDGVIFPPTFAPPEDARDEGSGYIIDELPDGTKLCLIDSVGSQANRMEPIFKTGDYAALVPQVAVRLGEREVNLLDAGHRAGDAIVRFSTLRSEVETAFAELDRAGDATRLAKLNPTALVFGAWDSRGTHVKIARLLSSTVRAYDVVPLQRAAQYNPPLEYRDEPTLGEIDFEKIARKQLSGEGLLDAPSGRGPGGILVRGEIRRDVVLNLATLRAIGGSDELRAYVLGLALVAMLHPRQHNLRQGCLLVRRQGIEPSLRTVHADGRREPTSLTITEATEFAKAAAQDFGVGASRTVEFDASRLKDALEGVDKPKKPGRRKKEGSP